MAAVNPNIDPNAPQQAQPSGQDLMSQRILGGGTLAVDPQAAMAQRILSSSNSDLPKSEPIDAWQRVIIQNIFDTQPKRRAAYMEKLGYEMDPKDDNKYRPLGAKHAFDMELDPGGVGNMRQYMGKGGLKEAAQDLGDVVWDVLTGIPQEAAGQAAGAVGAVMGGPVGALAGRAVGRATMYQAFEKVKDQIGNNLLEKDMPPDLGLRYTQMALQAAGPEIMGKGLQLGVKTAQAAVNGIGKGIRNMAGLGGGAISDTVMDAIKSDWKTFSDKNTLSSAGEAVQGMIDRLMGTDATETTNPRNLPSTSVFGKKLQALNNEKTAVISRLSSNRDAMPTVQQVLDPITQQIDRLADTPGKSQEELRALDYLKKKSVQIGDDLLPKENGKFTMQPDQVRVPFSVADDILTRFQDDTFDKGIDASSQLKQVAHDMRVTLQDHASKFDPEYASLKQKQAQIYDAFDAARKNITKTAALRTIVGGDTNGTSGDVGQRGMGAALAQVDDALGTKYYDSLRTGQIQNQVYKAMEASGKAHGSGGFVTAALPAAAASAAPFIVAGQPKAAALAGLAGGSVAGMASSPAISIPLIAGTARASDALGNAAASLAPGAGGPMRDQIMNFLSQQGSREAAPAVDNTIQRMTSPDDAMRSRILGP